MSTIVFDIEANGLLETITEVWVIATTTVDGKDVRVFTDQTLCIMKKNGSLADGVRYLVSQDKLVCHNIMGYDYHVLEKFWPHIWNRKTVPFKKIWDTFVQSKCQHFDRPFLKGVRSNHSLEYYGVAFKYPKPPIDDWTYWDEEKLNRVLVDIEINRKAYIWMNKEANKVSLDFTNQIRRTQAAQYWYAKQEQYGWYGDKGLMEKYVEELDQQIDELSREIEPNLPVKVKANKSPSERIMTKTGSYYKNVSDYFDIDQHFIDEKFSVGGAFTKVEFVPSKMSQHAIIKEYLLSIGWKPTQWNYQKNPDGSLMKDRSNQLIKKSPKLTEDSFDSIQGDVGNKIVLYNTLVHRRRTMKNEKSDRKGWINQLRPNGRIAAGALAWQTGTGRAAQFGIVNVPSAAAVFGAPMREVWTCPDGYTLISVDMDSAQMRLLANFMGDDEYTEAVISGVEFDENDKYIGTDAHTLNAKAFGTLTQELWEQARETQDHDLIVKCSSIRKTGKNGFYGMLFGAGDEKLANTLKIRGGKNAGAAIKESFRTKLSKAGELQDKLERQWRDNKFRGGGYIEVCGNTWVWCPSKHKLLNYLLMGSEAVLQNHAICWVNNQMEVRSLHGHQLAGIHDELTFEFPIYERDLGIQLLSEMYGVASEQCGLDVLVTGSAKAGKNWLEVH